MATTTRRFPSERLSRRAGFTPGPTLILADGKPWHLPALDAALIPHIARLVPSANEFLDYRAMVHRGEMAPDHPGLCVAQTWLGVFLMELLGAQYRCRRRTLLDLWRGIGDRSMGDLMDYVDEFARFSIRRYPAGFEGARTLAAMN